jgi:hypothetical protein
MPVRVRILGRNAAAFLETPGPRRSRSNSARSSASRASGWVVHLWPLDRPQRPSKASPTPISQATQAIVCPVSITRLAGSARNFGVVSRLFARVSAPLCRHRKPVIMSTKRAETRTVTPISVHQTGPTTGCSALTSPPQPKQKPRWRGRWDRASSGSNCVGPGVLDTARQHPGSGDP